MSKGAIWLIILIIILGLAVLGGGSYALYHYVLKSKDDTISLSPTSSNDNSNTRSISDWETYNNTQYGFYSCIVRIAKHPLRIPYIKPLAHAIDHFLRATLQPET